MKQLSLNGTWNMSEVGHNTSYISSIPGSVLSFLINNKVIKDPYYRDNEYEIRELFWKDYEFIRDFTVDESMMENSMVDLVCYGLDTLGEVYINGQLLAKTNNMHRTWRFSIKDLIHIGDNEIRIIFKSTLQYIDGYKYAENKEIHYIPCGGMKGNQLIRKAHSMFGWDWGAQLPDAGIFRDIMIEGYSEAKINDIRIVQEHKKEEVIVTLHTELDRFIAKSYQLEICIFDPEANVIASDCITIDSDSCKSCISIQNPRLWWPNGFGEHPLYQVKVTLISNEKNIDEKECRIGLRTLAISQEKDEWGSEFAFIINGIKIFTKGANYIPEDCVYSRITKERIEYLMKSSVRANYNCLRVWGGGYYPSDTFYDLCDEYGLIVWQDLMYACNVYDLTDEFAENIVEETKDNVKRLRHHASLGLWCGNNEIESAWDHWGAFQIESNLLRADYIKQFEYLLPKAVKEVDYSTFFWPSSPSSGGCFDNPDDENRGDTHYWSVWHGLLPFSDYQNHYFRFCSEFGFQSFPSIKTVKTYTEPEDRNIFSKVMESHQKNDAANGKMLYYLSENFCYPKDFESLLYVTQVLQGIAIKSGVEHFRRNRGRCMGSLYWQINDNWPVASWSSIDYFGRWKALHYMAKNFYEPIAGSMVRHGDEIEVHIQNESLEKVTGKVTLTLKTLNFDFVDQVEYETEVQALTALKIGQRDYSRILDGYNRDFVFAELVIVYNNGRTQIETETFVPYKHLTMSKPDIKVHVEETEISFLISLQSNVFANFIELDFDDADAIFEDNYFALTNIDPKVIELKKDDIMIGRTVKNAEDVKRHLRIRSIRDSYEY
jgi:beta-mannosidase